MGRENKRNERRREKKKEEEGGGWVWKRSRDRTAGGTRTKETGGPGPPRQ